MKKNHLWDINQLQYYAANKLIITLTILTHEKTYKK